MKALKTCIVFLAFCGRAFGDVAPPAQIYNLVQGIDKFAGSDTAWRLLETNGFVVADPAYKQIFEPYLDTALPPFITIDSAWETYQVLLSLGAKQLQLKDQPGSDFFTNTAEPRLPRRPVASGLDLFVAIPELRSPAAVRALREMSGDKVEKAVERVQFALAKNSISAESLRLLATLQQHVSNHLAPAFRSEAWADELLWSQMGEWIEQNHSRQLRPGNAEGFEAVERGPGKGAVAPYPDFFAGLARLSRQAEAMMEKAGLDERFDAKAVAQTLLDGIFLEEGLAANTGEEPGTTPTTRIQYDQFAAQYMETHNVGGAEDSPAAQVLLKDLEAVARRCLDGTIPNEADKVILQGFYNERMTPARLMQEFAVLCDKLAELAGKQADGVAFSAEDNKWFAGYGMNLARFHFYHTTASAPANDEPPIARPLATNAAGTSVLWAGLGHLEALYIILPSDGRLRLFRGAVLTYREFIRPAADSSRNKPRDESPWPHDAAQPPAFTSSFRAEKSAADILESLVIEPSDAQGYRELQENLDALQSRVTDADLPALIEALAKSDGAAAGNPFAAGIAAAIGRLNWKASQQSLLALIDKEDGACAGVVASILLRHPEWLDVTSLTANLDHSAARTRRVYTVLLGNVKPTEQSRAALLKAMQDDAAAVRWQGVLALGNSSWEAAQKISPLLERLSDSNELVAAAARTLGKIGIASVAPVLFSNLEQRLEAPAATSAKFQEDCEAVQDNILGNLNNSNNPFDPEHLLARAQAMGRRRGGPGARRAQFTEVSALIEALGELRYQLAAETFLGLLAGPNAVAAAHALKRIAPDKLAVRLTEIAADRNGLPQARDDALILLSDNPGANTLAGLIPLLDDKTVVPGARMMPGGEWRICDRAATTLASLMGRSVRMAPNMSNEQRDEQVEQVRQWLKSAY